MLSEMQVTNNENVGAVPASKSAKPAYQYSMENLRGLSILFVMLSHITTFGVLGAPGKYLWFLFGDATAWFVFISGYLFNFIEQRRFNYYGYLIKKAKFVIFPYLILSVPAVAAGLYFQRHLLMGLRASAYVLWSLLVGGSVIVPMWFIPMITVFFLVSPLSYRLGRSDLQYIILPIAMGVSLFTARPVDNMNPFLEFVHFGGFYILGIVVAANARVIDKFKETIFANLLIAFGLLIFSAASAISLAGLESHPLGFRDGLGSVDLGQFGKLGLLVAVFLLFERFLNIPNRMFGWIAEISFGLFFLQGFFMIFVVKLGQYITYSWPVMPLLVELTMVLGGSMAGVVLVKVLLGKWSRYVIGC